MLLILKEVVFFSSMFSYYSHKLCLAFFLSWFVKKRAAIIFRINFSRFRSTWTTVVLRHVKKLYQDWRKFAAHFRIIGHEMQGFCIRFTESVVLESRVRGLWTICFAKRNFGSDLLWPSKRKELRQLVRVLNCSSERNIIKLSSNVNSSSKSYVLGRSTAQFNCS